MKKRSSQISHLAAAFLLVTLTNSQVYADDTDIFLGTYNQDNRVKPNVLFILDDSGSMNTSLGNRYDPNEDYIERFADDDVYYIWEPIRNFFGNIRRLDFLGVIEKSRITGCSDQDIESNMGNFVSLRTSDISFQNNNNYKTSYNTPIEENTGNIQCSTAAAQGHGSYKVTTKHYANYQYGLTRIGAMKNVVMDLAKDLENVNLGLMGFRDNEGGFIRLPVKNLGEDNNRQDFLDTADKIVAGGNTPLTEVLWESKQYFQGGIARFSGPNQGTDTSISTAFVSGNQFQTPITEECQPNFAVLLTDGQPTEDTSSNNDIRQLTGVNCGYRNGDCLDELAGYMSGNEDYNRGQEVDLLPNMLNQQTVKVYPIGFANEGLTGTLQNISNATGLPYYTASTTDQLRAAFEEITTQAVVTEGTFVSPAIAVNSFNRLQHSNDVYFALFKPQASNRWYGNLKKYQIGTQGDVLDSRGNNAIVDSTSASTDEPEGTIRSNSKSFWSTNNDGATIALGGFAEKLTANRTVYTYTDLIPTSSINLTGNATNRLAVANTSITADLLGDPNITAGDRAKLIQWALGIDVDDTDEDGETTDPHNFVADPLHSTPVVVNYGGTEQNPDNVVFFGDNMGMLHAVNTANGEEHFAFIPPHLLKNIDPFYKNEGSINKVYGLDGPLVVWDRGNQKLLFVGMRRGGRNYYVLDVTDKTQPSLAYQITGGEGDFAELGQTWSKPTFARVRWGCTNGACTDSNFKDVVFFGGGYDPNQDNEVLTTANDSQGRAIFMIDAATGDKLYSFGHSGQDYNNTEMTNAFTADVNIIDIDGDGFHDTLFAVDILGKVWRFDLNQTAANASDFMLSGGMIANLSSTSTEGQSTYHHRFFNTPDVSFFNRPGEEAYLGVSVGSGYRASPLMDETTDFFYFFKDYNVFNDPSSYDYFNVLDNNFNITSSRTLTPTDLGLVGSNDPDFSYGWRLELHEGEKVLARSVTFNNNILFTTFSPSPEGELLCSGDLGVPRFYVVSAFSGGAMFNLNTDNGNGLDSFALLPGKMGIPPSPAIIYVPNTIQVTNADGTTTDVTRNEPTVCIGLFCQESDLEPVTKSFWRVNEN